MSGIDEKVATYASRVEAEIARAELEANGIPARVTSDDAGGTIPFLESAGVHLFVQAAHREAAKEVLSSIEPTVGEPLGNLVEAEKSVRSQEPRHASLLGVPVLDALILLTIGAVVGFALAEVSASQRRNGEEVSSGIDAFGTDISEDDRDQDGLMDAWYIFEGGNLVHAKVDRNFDGKLDEWQFYRAGEIVRVETDDNFDGTIDTWQEYVFENISVSTHDTDYNGIRDTTVEYRYGLPVVERVHPNGGTVELERRYISGAIREVYSVDPDGERTLIRTYDEVGRERSVVE